LTKDLGRRDPKLYLKEIIEYIDDLNDITQGLTYETFLQHKINTTKNKETKKEEIVDYFWFKRVF
jgi:septin family protein